MLPNRVIHVELEVIYMVIFNDILGIYWLYDCFVSSICRTRIFKFNFLNEPILEGRGEILFLDVIFYIVLRLVK